MTGYQGSKAASGVAERIIREMPPHETYVEAFAGYAAVFRKKRRAAKSLLLDADPKTCDHLRSYIVSRGEEGSVQVLHEDAVAFLPTHPAMVDAKTLVYIDPPYMREVRTRLLYDAEFEEPESHQILLKIALSLPCMVMISGYMTKLYAKLLKRWRLVKIPAMTRGGLRTECLWCNFPAPRLLHDSRWAGQNFRERERIKRRQKRWTAKFLKMPTIERQAIAAALIQVDRVTVEEAMAAGIADLTGAADGA
jgi:16S rRNA G966 N2-methylase RsmD